MAFLSALALILVTMVGYSSGAVLAAGRKDPTQRFIDLLLLIGLWTGGFVTRAILGRWGALGVWFLAALLVAYVVISLRKAQFFDAPADHFVQLDPSWSFFKQLWERWKVFGARLGHFQSRLLMGFFYFLVVSWVGLPVRLLTDFLEARRPPVNSAWTEKAPVDMDLDGAQQQF